MDLKRSGKPFIKSSLEIKCLVSFGVALAIVILISVALFYKVTKNQVEAQNPLMGNLPLGWRNRELGHFWGSCGFVAWMTRHRIDFRARTLMTAYSRNSLKEGKRKRSNWDGWLPGNLLCITSTLPLQDLLRIYHVRKCQTLRHLPLDCISPIGLYSI